MAAFEEIEVEAAPKRMENRSHIPVWKLLRRERYEGWVRAVVVGEVGRLVANEPGEQCGTIIRSVVWAAKRAGIKVKVWQAEGAVWFKVLE